MYLVFRFLFTFKDKGREGEEKGGKHRCVRETSMGCLSHNPSTRDLALTPGMYPDRESNQQPFDFQVSAQSTEPQQPGLSLIIFRTIVGGRYYCLHFTDKENKPQEIQ